MAESGPSLSDVKRLFANSGNRCAFPKCDVQIALNETLLGEMCHIKGLKLGSARHDTTQTNVERNAYDNLVLLCPNHHTVIDDDEGSYTVERLRKIKHDHEQQVEPASEAQANKVAQAFVQLISTSGQSGGLTAHTVHASTINVHSSGGALPQRQIEAIEHLWQVVQNLDGQFSLAVFVDTILLPAEIDAYFKGGASNTFMEAVIEYRDQRVVMEKLTNAGVKEAARERPFVTSHLWAIFFAIQGVYARAALLLSNSFKSERLVSWREDNGCDQFLRSVLPSSLVNEVRGLETNGLRTAIDHLQQQFLSEAGLNSTRV